ncbi:rhomboid family intramembrane serine protease [Sphingomonas gilva]|uniref:rhomboid family intramembrane serine protease n=1 Tax=Sphingomonas gilva TaxID=2305907 RepID=UPI0015FA43D2|nr:rhomboid family intramembrane serine protease [Sphingomonas gilva]
MFVFLFALFALGLQEAANRFGFIPLEFSSGAWVQSPVRALLTPLASQFLPTGIIVLVFNGLFLLLAGRFVEKAIGPAGLGAVFVAGVYGGALARLLLTPGSPIASAGSTPALFAVVGAYLMLYGVPRGIPIAQRQRRIVQIAALAGIWVAIQLLFMLAASSLEFSVSVIEPLGGLIAGVALARPLVRWRYRNA